MLKEKSKEKRTFTKEFKQEAIKMVLEDKHPQSEVARRLGVGASLLSGWIITAKTEGSDAFRGKGKPKLQDADIKRLQKENQELKQEIEFLKKSAVYFASLKK